MDPPKYGVLLPRDTQEEAVMTINKKRPRDEIETNTQEDTQQQVRQLKRSSTDELFPANAEKLQRLYLNAKYEIPTTTDQPTCLVSIVTHMHGHKSVVINRTNSRVTDAGFIVKDVPNGNTISTRLMAPAGEIHQEYSEGRDECPHYHSSLRIIYVSRMRLFSNLQCLPQVHFDETQPVKFLPKNYYNADLTGYSEEGLAYMTQNPDFKQYIDGPNYCQYFSEKRKYAEKVFSSNRPVEAPDDEKLFGIYIDIAIIEPKVGDLTKNTVTVKTFILSNTSQEFLHESLRYIEELLVGGDPKIKQELKELIKSGKCKLSTIIEAISSYTKNKGVPDGNTKLFLTDLSCSVYETFEGTPRKSKSLNKYISEGDLDEYNKEITSKLFEHYNIPENRAENYINDAFTGYENGHGLLTFAEIERSKISKEQMERQEEDKVLNSLTSKLPELRMKLAAGSLIFNKRQRRTRRGKRRTRSKRRRHTTKKLRRKKQ